MNFPILPPPLLQHPPSPHKSNTTQSVILGKSVGGEGGGWREGGERGEVSQPSALPTSGLTIVNAVVLVEEILLVRQ